MQKVSSLLGHLTKTALMLMLISIIFTWLISENLVYAIPNTIIDTVSVGDRPLGLAVDEVHNKIYVSNESDDTVTVIDGNTNSVITTINVGSFPRGVAVNEQTGKVYVSNQSGDTLSVISTSTDSVIATIPVGRFPFWIAINENTNLVYVSNAADTSVSVIDGSTDTVINTIPVGNSPERLTVHESTGLVYVPNRNDGTVSVIYPCSNAVTATITVLQYPSVIKIDESTNRAFVGSSNTAEITVINTVTNLVIDTLTFDSPTSEIEVNEFTNRLYLSQTGQFGTDFRGILVMDLTSFTTLTTIQNSFAPVVLDTNDITSRMYGTLHNVDQVLVYEIETTPTPEPEPETTTQTAKLTASDAAPCDRFGRSVSISGDTAIVGAYVDDDAAIDSGSAYVFDRNNGGADSWGQVAKLTASDAAASDFFGISVSISGDTAIVGAYGDDDTATHSGSAYVFDRNNGGADSWGQVAKLTASDATASDFFGISVSISGDTAIVGAQLDDDTEYNSGSAYVFGRDVGGADSWGQVAKLTASDAAPHDLFGNSVSILGDMAIVGARVDPASSTDSGSAYVFDRNNGGADSWGQVAKLTVSDAALGDQFGISVSISGDTAIVGAEFNDDAGPNSGSAYVFGGDIGGANSWGQVAKLTASDAAASDQFGISVSILGDTAIVGARGDDDAGSNSGSAYVFDRNNGGADSWGQVAKLTASDAAADDLFGISVSISGDTAIVGTFGDDDTATDSGSAYVFDFRTIILKLLQVQQDKSTQEKIIQEIIFVPPWIKTNAGWWADGQISDDSFVEGIKYLIKEDIMRIPETKAGTVTSQEIPPWIKQNAGWWSAGQISDESFVNGVQWLIKNGIMKIG